MSKIFPNHTSKKIAWLIDPENVSIGPDFKLQLHNFPENHIILIGGSTCEKDVFTRVLTYVKQNSSCLVLIFPGNNQQISPLADGILLLSLVSGNNPKYLIQQHVEAAQLLKQSQLTIHPTGYLLIDGGIISTTNTVTETSSIPSSDKSLIIDTALAATQLGMTNIYLEAGSGAINPIDFNTIFNVRNNITNQTLWVGGGIKSKDEINRAFDAGANVVVIGNAIEQNPILLKTLFE